ncbi:MAG: hypothetical protein HKN73_13200 [Gemmatimonadetes bacterium]|nr:hypothetical protein [Gemmatimonadota bacterium]
MDPETFFRSPTIAAMAEGKAKEVTPSWTEPVGPAPLTPVQRWFFRTVKDDRAHWNQDHVLVFEPGVLPTADVTRVMTTLVRHHDALRTRFVFDSHAKPLHQEIVGTNQAWVRIFTASSSQESDLRETLERGLVEAHGSMDLRRPELFRTVVVDYEGHVRLLALISHHLIVDAVSWGLLIEDLATLVDDTSSDPDGSLPPKTKPWAAWARDLAQRAEELDGPSLVHATDPGPPGPSPCALRGMGVGRVGDAVRHTVRFEKEDLAALDGARVRLEASMEELLLTGFLEAWHDWCGERTLLMDLEGHGRARDGRLSGVHRTVGWFTTVTPFRGRLGASPRDTLRAVQRAVPRARGSGLDQSLVRYLSRDPVMRAEMDRRLATDVVFNYLGTAASFPTHLPFSVQPGMTDFARSPRAQRGYALEVNALVQGGGLDVVIEGGPGSEEELVRLGHALRESLLGLSMVDPVPFDLDGFGDGDYETLSRLLGRLALQS